MYFKDIIGQEGAKQILISEAQSGRMPHARLITGVSGRGGLPLAVAYARYLTCKNRNMTDACGECADCRMMNNLAHPDVHFAFPVVKRKGKDTTSDDLLKEWREMLASNPYADAPYWMEQMGAENQQPQIYVKESDEIIRKLSLKSSQGGWKIMIIWLPEKMNSDCANKLLKLLEEPPKSTAFLMVTEEPETLLPTIRSRMQQMNLPPVKEKCITEALYRNYGIAPETARQIAIRSGGSWTSALEAIHTDEEGQYFLELFISLMRLAYARRIREMKEWSETMATLGRERQKRFLEYALRMIRENFVSNFKQPDMVCMNDEEQGFATRFAPFVNEGNIIGICHELTEAEMHIARNVNARMVFFDLALKMIVLLVKK